MRAVVFSHHTSANCDLAQILEKGLAGTGLMLVKQGS